MRFQLKHLSCVVAITWLALFVTSDSMAKQVEEFKLENGMRVVVNAVADASDIAVESFYQVGFVHEPENMVQSAHLLEHLICYSPGAGFGTKEAMTWLNQVGMANAETLPNMTHYDYAAPAEELEKILKIESARLQLEKFDRQLLLAEAKRVYQETDFVESQPQTGMVKHAFMSLSHAWKYQSRETLVRGGLEAFDLDKLHQFYQAHYRTSNLTLVITGKTTLEDAKRLVEKHFAQIPAGEPSSTSVDWSKVSPRQVVGWDSDHSSVCIAWKPPSDFRQKLLLSIVGLNLFQKVVANPELDKRCEMVMTSNNSWSVGELPLFIYAMAKPGEDLDEVETVLSDFFAKELNDSIESTRKLARGLAYNLEFQQKPTAWARAKSTANMLTKNGRSEQKSIQQVLLQDALTRGLAFQLLGDQPMESIEYLKKVPAEDIEAAIAACVTPENQMVVHLVPNRK